MAFKKSLFAGILDGGEKEVFLGESRLKRFMESVEKVTSDIPQTPPQVEAEPETDEEEETAGPAERPTTPMDNPLAGLLQNGLALLEQLASASGSQNGHGKKNGQHQNQAKSPFETATDDRTGQTYLKVPMPDTDVLNKAFAAINTLMESLRR